MADGGTMNEQVYTPDAANTRPLRDAFGRFATGVTVVTIAGADGPVGFTANSFASVSLDPALVLWSPAKSAQRFAIFAAAPQFAIHILAADQLPLAHRFVRGGDGFAGLDHGTTPEGLPALPHVLARFDCSHHAAHDGGDHMIIVGRVLRATIGEGHPLAFSQGHFGSFLPNA